jgi:hypothetical protein
MISNVTFIHAKFLFKFIFNISNLDTLIPKINFWFEIKSYKFPSNVGIKEIFDVNLIFKRISINY